MAATPCMRRKERDKKVLVLMANVNGFFGNKKTVCARQTVRYALGEKHFDHATARRPFLTAHFGKS